MEANTRLSQLPEMRLLHHCSVDGHPLPIDELRGVKPTETIDLSNKELSVASGIIIASCIAGNEHLKLLSMSENQICGQMKQSSKPSQVDRGGMKANGTFTHDAIKALCEALTKTECNLTSLDLSNTQLGVSGPNK